MSEHETPEVPDDGLWEPPYDQMFDEDLSADEMELMEQEAMELLEQEEREQAFETTYAQIVHRLMADGVGTGQRRCACGECDSDGIMRLAITVIFYDEFGGTYSVDDFTKWLAGNPGDPCRACGAPDPSTLSPEALKLMHYGQWWHDMKFKMRMAWRILRVKAPPLTGKPR